MILINLIFLCGIVVFADNRYCTMGPAITLGERPMCVDDAENNRQRVLYLNNNDHTIMSDGKMLIYGNKKK